MKNVLTLLFLVICSLVSAQIIDFPDANFKNALVNTKFVQIVMEMVLEIRMLI